MNDKYAALKSRIEKALEDFTNGRASMHVPVLDTDVDLVLYDCLELLAERDADKRRIAELDKESQRLSDQLGACDRERRAFREQAKSAEAQIKNLKHFIAFWRKVQSGTIKPSKNEIDHTVWFLEGIAELESRTLNVKLPTLNPQMFNDDVMFGYRKAQREAVEYCAAAGISLKIEGE